MNGKKGMTLAELCVGIALLAIVVTMTLTFSQLNREHLRQAEENDALMTDLTTFEERITLWLREYDNAKYNIEVKENGTKLVMYGYNATNKNYDVYSSDFYLDSDGKIKMHDFYLDSDGKIIMQEYNPLNVSNITSMVFDVSNKSQKSGRVLVICRLHYHSKADNEDRELTYSFTLKGQNTKVYDVTKDRGR